MIVLPAVDLRDGACVQLVGGEYEEERVRLDDPVGVARNWAALGFQRLHVVDLDASTAHGQNATLVRAILQAVDIDVQVGGGIRTANEIDRLLQDGADRVVLGTRAIEEPGWLADIAAQFPQRIVVAADVRDRRVVTRGWARTTARNVLGVIEDLNELPLAALLVTAVHREGRLAGTDLFLMEDVTEISAHPVIALGGITTLHELRELEERGVSEVVVGMALYTGLLNASSVVDEFST